MPTYIKKLLKVIAIIIPILLSLSLFGKFFNNNPSEKPITGMMTFEVTIPKNTLEEDVIYIFPQTNISYRMFRIDDNTYTITLSKDQLTDEEDIVKYRYGRTGHDFDTAEFLEPDTNNYFWMERGRTIYFEKDSVQNDAVTRWRWFPKDDIPIITTSNLEPEAEFIPRINGEQFKSLQVIEDLYSPAYDDFFSSTADHLVNVGYTTVEIAPPWQWYQEDGLPKAGNIIDENPNYPNDEKLKEEINAYRSVGLEVMLSPQLCCTVLDTEITRSEQWWDSYFSEITRFLTHHAKIAQETDVSSFHFSIGHDYSGDDYAQRWSTVFKEIREVYSGEVGQGLWSFGLETGEIIPDADYITWGSDLDYFYLAVDAPISMSNNPTDQELIQGAGVVMDGVKQLYDRYNKPIIVRTTYFNVKETWKGSAIYSISSVPWPGASEKEVIDSEYEFKPEDLARVVNAYFKAASSRPWIIGYGQFGYSHWANPLAVDLSVRNKPAEDIWRKWNIELYGN